MSTTRVVLIGLDGFPPEVVSPELTPVLWSLAGASGRSPTGGRAGLPSSTYPGFGSLLTGCRPQNHGVRVTTSTGEVLPAWAGASSVLAPTLFDRCQAAGKRSAAVHGDFELHHVLRTGTADLEWPGASPDPSIPRDAHGYPTNAAVLPRLLDVLGDEGCDFVWGHLNEPDTLGHDLGPGHPDSLRCYAETDAAIGAIVEALRPRWSDSVLMIVSDHGMEPRVGSRAIAIDLDGEAGAVVDAVQRDGGAALARPRGGVPRGEVERVLGGIEGVDRVHAEPDLVLLTARPGWIFAGRYSSAGGFHGGESTRGTVAAVGGGHPAAAAIGASIARLAPELIDWAPTIAAVLGLNEDRMDGQRLT